jgi:hypothetical protein
MAKAKKQGGPKDVQRSLIQRRTDTIEKFSIDLTDNILAGQKKLAGKLIAEFALKLETKGGRLLHNLANRRLLTNIDRVYSEFLASHGKGMIKILLDGVDEVLDLNREYFKGFASEGTLTAAHTRIKANIYEMLGVTENRRLQPDGYLNTVMSDNTIPARIKMNARKAIYAQTEAARYQTNLQNYVAGTETSGGVMQSFYRENAMDVVAQTDRSISTSYANDLNLEFAIYEGNIILTTREFCKERAGKVFHISEIKKFNPKKAKPPQYNPLLDLGGYNCRHHLNWISTELALRLRPDAAKFVK